MPELITIGNVKISIHYADYTTPHIHAFIGNISYRFSIRTLRQLRNDIRKAPNGLPRRIRQLFRDHKDWLMEQWNKCQAGQQPDRFKPT